MIAVHGELEPETAHAVQALGTGDAAPALRLLAATRTDPDRREHCVSVLGEGGAAIIPAVRAAVERNRDDADAMLLLGSAQVAAAWDARGGDYAEHTSDEQFGQLVDLIRQARSTLRRAAALAPDDAAPWGRLLACALGAPEDDDEGARVFAEITARAPDLWEANTTRLQMLSAKWGGSHEEMLAFARERTADRPPGHPLLALVPAAHLEVQLANLNNGNFFKRLWRGMWYLGREHVRGEVCAASDRLLAGTETYRSHPQWSAANQVFAAYYHQALDDAAARQEDRPRLAAHLAQSGPRPTEWQWGYWGDPDEQFGKAHQAAAWR